MTDSKPQTLKATRQAMQHGMRLLDRISDLATHVSRPGDGNAQDLFARAMGQSRAVEREHRALGFTGGQTNYRAPIDECAALFVCQHVGKLLAGEAKRPKNWRDASSYRQDVATSYALGECIKDAARDAKHDPSDARADRPAELRKCLREFRAHPVHSIDYASDIANH